MSILLQIIGYVPISNGTFETLLGTKFKYLFHVLLFETLKTSINALVKHILNPLVRHKVISCKRQIMQNIYVCFSVFVFVLGYTDSQVVDVNDLYRLLQEGNQANRPKAASQNPDEKIDVEGLTQRLDLLENEISLLRKAQQPESDKT